MQRPPFNVQSATFGLVLSLAVGTTVTADAKTETFDTAPGDWVSSSNSASFPTWSNTNNTGGDPDGEAGGTFPLAWGHYGDTSLGGTLDFSQDLSITGEISSVGGVTSDPLLRFGYFNTANELSEAENFIGFRVVDSGAAQYRVSAIYLTSADTSVANTNTSALLVLDQNTDYTFVFDYDADGGVSSVGGLSLSIFDAAGTTQIGSTLTTSVTPGAIGEGISLNALGWQKVNGNAAQVYVDNLAYTVIPEPGALALLTMGGVMVARRRKA